jgi:adenosylcobinamide-GDP ribazoletransferase
VNHILLNARSVKAFLFALSLLTRLPVARLDNIQANDSGRSALFYPLVGLIIGLFLYVPVFLFSGASYLLLAAIVISGWAVITGGLHLDGLADSADAWLGGGDDKEKTQRIMKDPRVGAAGVVAIVSVVLLKFSALTALFQAGISGLIFLAPIVGRSMILLLFITSKYVSSQGMASSVVEYLPRTAAMWVIGVSLLFGMLFSFWGMLCALAGFWLLRRLMLKRLGGCTGDTVGATVEITEMFFLVGSALGA